LGFTRAYGLVEPCGALFALNSKRLVFRSVCHAEPERWQQTTVRQLVQARHRLCEQHGIAARQDHHAGTNLELLGAGDRKCHTNHRVEGRPVYALREPQ